MKIEKVEAHWVQYKDEEYLRFGPNNWWQAYGMSYESVWDDEELEKEWANMQMTSSTKRWTTDGHGEIDVTATAALEK